MDLGTGGGYGLALGKAVRQFMKFEKAGRFTDETSFNSHGQPQSGRGEGGMGMLMSTFYKQ